MREAKLCVKAENVAASGWMRVPGSLQRRSA